MDFSQDEVQKHKEELIQKIKENDKAIQKHPNNTGLYSINNTLNFILSNLDDKY